MKKNSKTMRSPKNATQGTATTLSTRTVGIDLGDQTSCYCILDEQGDVVSEGTVRTTEAGFREQFRRMARARIVLETGTHSPWVSRYLERLGHEVLVANARQVRIIYDNDRKTDKCGPYKRCRCLARNQCPIHLSSIAEPGDPGKPPGKEFRSNPLAIVLCLQGQDRYKQNLVTSVMLSTLTTAPIGVPVAAKG